jgi:hypothetical protein
MMACLHRAKANNERSNVAQNIDEAFRMLDAFTSVGASSFVVTKTDINQSVKWGKNYSLAALREKLPSMVRTAAIQRPIKLDDGLSLAAGENLILRPMSDKVHFVQLDDLDAAGLSRVGEAAFLTLQTSPGNHQAWIAVSDLQEAQEAKDFARRLRKGVGADKSASGATRVAGTTNYKPKYAPAFPTVKIVQAHPGRVVKKEQLESMGIVAEAEPQTEITGFARKTPQVAHRPRAGKVWPDYSRSLAGAPPSLQGDGPDRSMADFSWCMTAIDWGWSIEDTAMKLQDVSTKAAERVRLKDTGYPLITAQNAAAAVERNFMKRGRG